MTMQLLAARLELPAPVGLDDLQAAAALLTRRDRKYIVPEAVAAELVARLAGASRALEMAGRRSFRYESVYFDTPADASYLGAARRRPRRYKVRTRAYLDAGRCLLEIKTRGPRGHTVKERLEHPIELRSRLDAAGRAFVRSCPLVGDDVAALAPALVTRYGRATLLVDAVAARVTIDTDVEAATPDGRLVVLAGMAIVETKSGGPPSVADQVLWSLGHRPTRVSKFCTSLAALRPELPSNKWTRALQQPWVLGDAPGRLAVPGAA
jgi:hypothetical protein